VLNECESEEVLERMRRHPAYKDMDRVITEAASYVHTIAATNPRRIGPVDHTRQGVFLFNYFVADSVAQNLGVWVLADRLLSLGGVVHRGVTATRIDALLADVHFVGTLVR